MSDAPARPAPKKTPDVRALRCLGPNCNGLLAYEVDSDNVLYTDLAWTARTAGDLRFLPCPKCGGRNVLESLPSQSGTVRHRVARWEPGDTAATFTPEEYADLELIPRPIRDKLDRAGVKLHLREWQALAMADRVRLRDLPCVTDADAADYAAAVDHLVRRIAGAPAERLAKP